MILKRKGTSSSAHFFITVLLIFATSELNAQFGFEFDGNIPVLKSGDTMKNAWSGGFNYPQFSDFDYDFDGDLDLFVLDRSTNNIRVFVQEGGPLNPHYRLEYNAHNYFPSDVRYRATMVDYNGDGKKDLFTYGIGGIKVYKNVGDIISGIQWELAADLLNSQYPTIYTNLYVSSSDIPAIVDVDADGDIDILTFSQSGSHVEYHQNQSMDLYGHSDSLVFELRNECWGKFSEDVNTNSVVLNDPNAPCVGGNIGDPEGHNSPYDDELQLNKAHSGSTLLAIDVDNSGVLDLIIGDISFTNMNLLVNGGTAVNSDSPMVSVDPAFPSNTTPVDIELFPAAFYLDVDFDGVKDLLACPNAKNVSDNETSVHYYKNIGTDSNPNFIFQSNNFLQKEMIEHGTGSIPVLFDYDEDGLEDLLVANFYRFLPGINKESTIAYYRNIGTNNNPSYQYIDYNLLNLNQENFGLRSVPTFGDVDGDGDEDMFLGLQAGTLAYYENTSVGSGAVFSTYINNYQDNNGNLITTGSYCFPQLIDLDNDGLLDLVLGKKNGMISFYRNIGTINSPSFELYNDTLGQIDVSTVTPDGYAAPHFFRHNDTLQLFLGANDGKMHYYNFIENQLEPGDTFNLVSDNLLNLNVERFSSFFNGDVDNDGEYDLFVGQDLGGLFHFETDPNSTANIETTYSDLHRLVLFPNPTSNLINLIFGSTFSGTYNLSDFSGRTVGKGIISGTKSVIDMGNLVNGVYIIQIANEVGTSIVKRVVKQ